MTPTPTHPTHSPIFAHSITLAGALWPARDAAHVEWLRRAALAVFGCALLTISAKVQIPFWPVPFTMQTMIVLLAGMALGWRLGAATVALYLAQGAMGFPVFAQGGGIAYFAGPTGGYLLGFLAAAALTGWLAERGWGRSALSAVAAMLAGTAVIFACGLAWLSYLIGAEKAIVGGLVPFLTSEGLKIVIAAILMPACWRFAGIHGRGEKDKSPS